MKRDLLSHFDLTADEIRRVFARTVELKAKRARSELEHTLPGRTLGMIFEKASTRTRVSFEVGMFELGGHAVYLVRDGTQIGRGEPLRDTARVLGGYCHGIVVRTFGHAVAEELARFSPVPVLNGLTDLLHPCQVLADMYTVQERLGVSALEPGGARFAWLGDGNNMANSWIEACALLGLELTLACPEGYDPDPTVLERAKKKGDRRTKISIVRTPIEAARGRDVLSTDVWASMGQESEQRARTAAFSGFCFDEALLAQASPRAMVLHCLPAHRGEEITEAVLEGSQSAVFSQAENRLHVQKAILEMYLAPR